jgi:hypothetical protein
LVKLVGTLLLYFDLEIQHDEQQPVEIPASTSYFFARMTDPVVVTVKERD